jgi:hypothetical protein
MSMTDNFVNIRGRRLDLDDLVDKRLRDEAYLLTLRDRIRNAHPFPHFVEEGWFNPVLLELVLEEFEDREDPSWKPVIDKYQDTHRSAVGKDLGPASQLYFSIVNAGWFVRMLSVLTGIDDLIVDVHLYGGGLHETRPGGMFGIHRDFDRNVRTGLHNEMVFITYLNKNWQPEWNGALELWDPTASKKVTSVEPEFGRSIMMRHGKTSFHGHPIPLTPPPGVVRRSLATYFYTNRFASIDREARESSLFLFWSTGDRVRRFGKAITPPILWDLISGSKRHERRNY